MNSTSRTYTLHVATRELVPGIILADRLMDRHFVTFALLVLRLPGAHMMVPATQPGSLPREVDWTVGNSDDGTYLLRIEGGLHGDVVPLFGGSKRGTLYDGSKSTGVDCFAMLPGDAVRVGDTIIHVSRDHGNSHLDKTTIEMFYQTVVLPLARKIDRFTTDVMHLQGV